MLILFARVTILYLIVFLIIRLTGKRQISDLQPFDLVITLLIADLASQPAANTDIPLLYGIVPILTLFLIHQTFAYFSMKSMKFRKLICGQPLILIHDGKIQEKVMHNIHYTIHDLTEQLRLKDVFDLSQVACAVLETNGSLSVFLKGAHQQPAYQDFSLPSPASVPPNILIIDGQVEQNALRASGHSKDWLLFQLRKTGFQSISDVLFASLNYNGILYTQGKATSGGKIHTLSTQGGRTYEKKQ